MKALPILLFLAQVGYYQPIYTQKQIELKVRGDVEVVVRSLPAVVEAPEGGDLYFWTYPQTVGALDKGRFLEIKTAAKGRYSVSCKIILIDWDKKKLDQKFGSIVVVIGDGPNPKPPPPDDRSDFEKRLQQAYDTDGKNSAMVLKLISLYSYGANEASKKSHAIIGDWVGSLVDKSNELKITGLQNVRSEISRYLADNTPSDLTAPMTAGVRLQFETHCGIIVNALKKLN